MPESNLTNCVHCGHKVSQSAILCPSCGGLARGVACSFCGQQTPLESVGQTQGLHTVYFCESCIQRRFTPPADQRCNDCGTPLPRKTGRDILATCFPYETFPAPLTCPSCGSIRPFGEDELRKCDICYLPIFAFQKSIHYRDSTGRQRHEFCRRPRAGCLGLALLALAVGGVVLCAAFAFCL